MERFDSKVQTSKKNLRCRRPNNIHYSQFRGFLTGAFADKDLFSWEAVKGKLFEEHVQPKNDTAAYEFLKLEGDGTSSTRFCLLPIPAT